MHVEWDPAVLGEPPLVLDPERALCRDPCHRVAHAIWQSHDSPEKRRIAMAVSHFGRVSCRSRNPSGGADRAALCVDHGTNTVIGADHRHRRRLHILNAVIPGARGIKTENPQAKRHPTLASQVGAFFRIWRYPGG